MRFIKKTICAAVIFLPLFLSFACSAFSGERIKVFVSIPPQKYFLEKIGQNLLHVSIMVNPGSNPHIYEPRPGQMKELSSARAYFTIGVNFEDVWIDRFKGVNPDIDIFDMDKGIQKISMVEHHEHEDHEDREKGGDDFILRDNGHEVGLDPHIWTSPVLVKKIAMNTLKGILIIDPANKDIYQEGYEKIIREIDLLDKELVKIFKGKEGMEFMVFHPSWNYFAKTYGLKQVPIEIEGKEPKPVQLISIIKYAKEHKIRVIFVQPQFSKKSAKIIAKEIHGEVIFADPLAEDWANNLKMQAEKFKAALR